MRGRTYHSFRRGLILFLMLSLVCVLAMASPVLSGNDILVSNSTLNTIFSRTLITFLVAIILVILVSLYFIRKLRRMNVILETKNGEIEKAIAEQAALNAELARQRDTIARELADSEKLYTILVESASDGISFFDSSDRLILANTAFYSCLGMTREEYNAVNPDDLLHPECKNYVAEKLKSLNESGFYQTELLLHHRAGHYIVLSTRAVQIRNNAGEVIGSLSISRDITEVKKTEQDLIDAKEMAEASNRLKSSFLANISHEIRTPLNSVVGFSNLLMMSDITREQKNEYVELINSNSEKLLQIIGDIIDLSRLESSQIEICYEETSLRQVIREVMEDTGKNIRRSEKPVALKVINQLNDVSDMVFTDKTWLKRVLRHLLDNAVKFTLEGEITLRISLVGKELIFTIADTGIGIDSGSIDRIFEQFNQEFSGLHRPFEGLGVGLTLVKQVVDRMGGRVTVSSRKGAGSEFSFTVPFRPATTVREKANGPVQKSQKNGLWNGIKCLVVDDNKDVLLYLTRMLLDTGVQTVTARSGKEALEQLGLNPGINMILLDMQMPEMNGIETAIEIRKKYGSIPIIAQTAYIFEDNKREVIEAGCDACLVKPIRRDNLIAVMTALISSN
ncbi:MAG: ATP-binding protein [Bacteroidales bacterium]|nr:ATP-binding protein [Bacteroidales bacterium]